MPEQLVGRPKQVGGVCEWGWAKMAVPVVQAVRAVHLDAFVACLNHTVSTEKEEVMGLCIGALNGDLNSDSKFTYTGTEICTVAETVDINISVRVYFVIILQCSDKKDRVETSPNRCLWPQQRKRGWVN